MSVSSSNPATFYDEDEAHRLIQEDCKKLNILRRKLSKPCNYADISPRPNEFHWAHSGRCYFSRFSAPKPASLENKRGPEPATFDSSGEEESFDEYKSGWRFLDVSEGAEERLDTLKLYTELKNIRRMLSKPCDYRKIAPASYNNEFHWTMRGRCYFNRFQKPLVKASEPSLAEYRIVNELRDDTLRYIAQQLCVEAMEREQTARIAAFQDKLFASPTCEAIRDELLVRADAKAFAQVAHAWSKNRKYSDILPTPDPIRTHFSAFGRNVFNTNQFMRSEIPGAVQCLSPDGGDLESTLEVLQMRADARAFAAVAHAFQATGKYSEICPVPRPIRTHFSAFGRNVFNTNQFMRSTVTQNNAAAEPDTIFGEMSQNAPSIKPVHYDESMKGKQPALGSPESIMSFPGNEDMPELFL